MNFGRKNICRENCLSWVSFKLIQNFNIFYIWEYGEDLDKWIKVTLKQFGKKE